MKKDPEIEMQAEHDFSGDEERGKYLDGADNDAVFAFVAKSEELLRAAETGQAAADAGNVISIDDALALLEED